jgi:tRNA(His) guanylyltransferase
MKFDDFDAKMRIFETAHDYCVLPGLYMVARLDGRNFTRLTKEICQFEVPFDVKFRDMMTETVKHLMNCGFRILYGYTQSDEISLLFHLDENAFNRKLRKFNSVLAAEASAKFSLLLGQIGCFDARISQLPTKELVCDYFRWRQADAHRNALNSHCYWLLRKEGQSQQAATIALLNLSVSDKNELLFSHGINFNDCPPWQKRGVGLYWETYEKQAMNPKLGTPVTTTRKRIKCHLDLPMKEEYGEFLLNLMG